MEPENNEMLALGHASHCCGSVTARKAKPWLSHCDGSTKSDFLNASFSLGSSSQSHD
jgi:hypothetical protein